MLPTPTLVSLLRDRAASQPADTAFIFLHRDGTERDRLTYRALDERARTVAAHLLAQGAAGARVMLLYPPGLEFVSAFFGCLYAGAVSVPAYPIQASRDVSRLRAVVADARAGFALTDQSLLAFMGCTFAQDPELSALCWLATDSLPAADAAAWRDPAPDSDALALIQYTSGSTGAPRGVMVSHRNLLHNQRMIKEAFGHDTERTVVAGWLPVYHDMGLIGNVLQPLYLGRPCILLSPLDFLHTPLLWLQAISRYRATTSGGPSFAYDLCVRRISEEQRAGLDLSSWDVAFNGAEPVRAEVLERFTAAFAPAGFRKEAFYPCYGLAEATLLVSGGDKAAAPIVCSADRTALEQDRVAGPSGAGTDVRRLVGCGRTRQGQRVVIVDPQSLRPCGDEQVGEIWVSGPCVARGYWERQDETRETFQACLLGSGEGPFLRTGDLGFLRGGELFVTGRLKDLIIVRGRNHYPGDVELTVEQCHPALRPGCGAAFSVEVNGEERLVVVQEVARRSVHSVNTREVIGDIRQAVAARHGLRLHEAVLIVPGSIPKTSSGKIQRRACRARFLARSLEPVSS